VFVTLMVVGLVGLVLMILPGFGDKSRRGVEQADPGVPNITGSIPTRSAAARSMA